jgi:hypothetical protein
MDIPEVPKVFFIRGVFKHSARSITEIIESRIVPDVVEPLARTYEDWSDEVWLQQRAVRCTTCPRRVGRCEEGASHPARQIFIPVGLERTKKGTIWKPHDTTRFCSWSCAQYHIVYFLKNDDRFSQLLKHLYHKWTGKTAYEISVCEPPWHCVDLGGDRTLEELHRINDFNMARLQSSFDEDEPDDDDDDDDEKN